MVAWSDETARREEKRQFQNHVLFVLLVLFVIWTIKIVENQSGISLSDWGLRPRTPRGLLGIVTMPFLHGDVEHLISNSVGWFILGLGLLHFYPKVAARVLLHSWFWGGLLVWVLARPSSHIGLSGIIYSLSAFLFLGGVLRRDRRSVGAALIVALLYGASVWGMLPYRPDISWEGHLFGAIVGVILAIAYRGVDLPKPDDWDEEEEIQPTSAQAEPEPSYGDGYHG